MYADFTASQITYYFFSLPKQTLRVLPHAIYCWKCVIFVVVYIYIKGGGKLLYNAVQDKSYETLIVQRRRPGRTIFIGN